MTVNQILNVKGRVVYAVSPMTTVYDALKEMGDKNIGAILVMEGSVLKGILSERDYARKVVLKDKSSKLIPVSEIMEPNVFTISETDDIEKCMALMSDKRIRHLPVKKEDEIVGLVSVGDVVKAIIETQKDTIQHLNSYISQ